MDCPRLPHCTHTNNLHDFRSFAPYATAASCIGAIDAGFANVDLRGTPFKLKPNQFWIYGINVVGGVQVVSDQVINMHAGGECGFAGPMNSTFYQEFPVTETPPSKRYLELEALLVPWPSNSMTPSGTPSPSVTPSHTDTPCPSPDRTPPGPGDIVVVRLGDYPSHDLGSGFAYPGAERRGLLAHAPCPSDSCAWPISAVLAPPVSSQCGSISTRLSARSRAPFCCRRPDVTPALAARFH